MVKLALLYQDGNFVGREYHHRLTLAGLKPDFTISVGKMSEASIAREIERTGGKWYPPPIDDGIYTAPDLDDAVLWQSLAQDDVLAINGGVGIIRKEHLKAVPRGMLNVHPGKLPEYRGCSCPEWAIFHGDPVICTAHMIDEGVDTGPVLCSAEYSIKPGWDYHDFRANLYAHCAEVLIQAVIMLEAGEEPTPQSQANACYWPPMGADNFEDVKAKFRKAA